MVEAAHEHDDAPIPMPGAGPAHSEAGGAEVERVLWRGGPSQLINFKVYALCLVLSVLVVPIFYALWRYLTTRSHQYELTTERIRLRTGVFSKRTDDLELYRVRDTVLEEPFFYRLFGMGNLLLQTSDRTHAEFRLEAVKDPDTVLAHIRRQVERMRQDKRVREVDFE